MDYLQIARDKTKKRRLKNKKVFDNFLQGKDNQFIIYAYEGLDYIFTKRDNQYQIQYMSSNKQPTNAGRIISYEDTKKFIEKFC